MRILSVTCTNSPNFTAKKKEIRRADDIQRAARKEFPMLSSTYVAEKYGVYDKNSKYNSLCQRGMRTLSRKIRATRDDLYNLHNNTAYRIPWMVRNSDVLTSTLDVFKKHKVGNCSESGQLALAALYANGYYNSKIVDLHYVAQAVNEDGDVLCSVHPRRGLDHVFVVTDMNEDEERDIVVDPWFGFADSFSGACDKFKDTYLDEIDKLKEKCEKKIKRLQKLKLKDKEDYQIRGNFFVKPYPVSKTYSSSVISGIKIREKYPELVIEDEFKE